MKLGYLIPAFPGQTHIWMWREITHLRQWGVPVQLFSTRRPPARDRARHAFAAPAERETTYLVDRRPAALLALLVALAWALCTRPRALGQCVWLALRLPVAKRPHWLAVLPLVPPACRLAREVRRRGITHLHCHTCASGAILAMFNKRLTGVPFSLTLNADLDFWGGAMRAKLGDAQFTLAITQGLVDWVRRDLPDLPAEQTLLGRIGVDTRRWAPTAASSAPKPAVRVISVGRLVPSKGFDTLLRAVAQLLNDDYRLTLQIVGAGPERTALGALANALGIGPSVLFTGSLSEHQVIAELRRADLFVLASVAEPLGVAYTEAMALGLPVIGTAAGGVPEIIQHGVNGLLVPPRDPAALAQAMRRLIDDPALRRALGAAGRRTAVSKFDSRLGAATLYQCVLGAPPPEPLPTVEPVEAALP